jgi:protease-4
MKRFFVRLLALIGGLVVLAVIVVALVVVGIRMAKARVPGKTLLEVNLETGLLEYVPDDPLAQVMLKDKPTLRGTVEALKKASGDPKVVGLIATLGAAPMGMGQVQELRDAVIAFRAQKKTAIAYSETFGEAGPGNGAYYLATAFDEIWLQPSGDVGLTGFIFESPFLRGTLEKLGVTPRMDQRYEYKNAMNLFTERKYTPAHREAIEKVMTSFFAQVVRGTAQGRKLTEEQVRALVDRGPFLGQEAVEAKLVDGLAYRDEVYENAKKKAGAGAKLLYLGQYAKRAGPLHNKGKTVALIFGVGNVHRGKSDFDPFTGDSSMGSDTVTAAFRSAIEDKDVKAILFRVDSGGGSYVASDAIWRETVRAKKAGKPVIASMGDVAGSGGYFVAMAADKIVAQPGTITGSIGVLGGKMLTTGFWDKLGLTWDEVHTSANATMWTGTHDFTPAEWARFQGWLDRIYADFTSKVADGRKLPKEKVLELAKGRIWSGEDAKALGLIDEVGGYDVALKLAKQAAKIPETEDVKLEVFPARKEPLEKLLEGPPESSEKAAVAAWVRVTEALRPVVRKLQALGLWDEPGVLSMQPVSARP